MNICKRYVKNTVTKITHWIAENSLDIRMIIDYTLNHALKKMTLNFYMPIHTQAHLHHSISKTLESRQHRFYPRPICPRLAQFSIPISNSITDTTQTAYSHTKLTSARHYHRSIV